MTRRRTRNGSTPESAALLCAPYLPELRSIVLRCLGDALASRAVVDEVVRRACDWITDDELPPPVVRLQLFRIAREVVRERARDQRATQPGPVAPPADAPALSEG